MNHIGKDRAACCQYFLVYTTTDWGHKSNGSTSLLKRFMFDEFFSQTSHDFLHTKRLLGFLRLIPGTRERKLLQTIGSHGADQLHLPLRAASHL